MAESLSLSVRNGDTGDRGALFYESVGRMAFWTAWDFQQTELWLRVVFHVLWHELCISMMTHFLQSKNTYCIFCLLPEHFTISVSPSVCLSGWARVVMKWRTPWAISAAGRLCSTWSPRWMSHSVPITTSAPPEPTSSAASRASTG